jgi:Protein of unknown function (DUF3617)
MNLRKLTLAAAALTLCALPTFAASPQKPGSWQITMEMDAPNMPMKMPPMTFTHCVTQEDVENPDRAIPKGKQNSNCKVSDFKVDGQKISWSVKCEGKEPVTGNGEITFDNDTYTGWSKMHVQDQDMTMKWSGKRLGDCK